MYACDQLIMLVHYFYGSSVTKIHSKIRRKISDLQKAKKDAEAKVWEPLLLIFTLAELIRQCNPKWFKRSWHMSLSDTTVH